MITAIAIVLALFIFLFDQLKGLFIFLLLCLIIYMVIKEFINRKYSRNPFRKIKETPYVEYIIMMINHNKNYKKYIVKDNNIILIMKNGIYFIKLLDYKNKISGNINGEYLIEKIGNKEYKVRNKIKNYYDEYSIYQSKISYQIEKYIIVRNDCMLNIDDKKIKIINSKNFYFKLDNQIKKYTNEQIDMIYNKFIM